MSSIRPGGGRIGLFTPCCARVVIALLFAELGSRAILFGSNRYERSPGATFFALLTPIHLVFERRVFLFSHHQKTGWHARVDIPTLMASLSYIQPGSAAPNTCRWFLSTRFAGTAVDSWEPAIRLRGHVGENISGKLIVKCGRIPSINSQNSCKIPSLPVVFGRTFARIVPTRYRLRCYLAAPGGQLDFWLTIRDGIGMCRSFIRPTAGSGLG